MVSNHQRGCTTMVISFRKKKNTTSISVKIFKQPLRTNHANVIKTLFTSLFRIKQFHMVGHENTQGFN